jgi:hypothetical protein
VDWQQALSDLDGRLARGEVSASEHRRRRDEILAEASSVAGRSQTRAPWETTAAPPRDFTRPPDTPPVALDGMEVFGAARPARKPWVAGVVLLAVLAVVGGGIWWMAFRGDTAAAGAAPTTTAAPVALADRVPTPQGVPNDNNATMTVDGAIAGKLLSQHDADLYRAHGVTEVVYRGSRSDNVGLLVMAAKTSSQADAVAVADGVHKHLVEVGFVDIAGTRPVSFGRTDARFATIGSVYRSGQVSVLVSVSADPKQDPARLRAEFDSLLKTVTNALPEG